MLENKANLLIPSEYIKCAMMNKVKRVRRYFWEEVAQDRLYHAPGVKKI